MKPLSEFDLFNALKSFYPQREYALLPQVANGTGAGSFRHCDALALSLWPSRGLSLHGFEIKSYRGDWIREKRNPEKAEEIAAYCNYWWIVAAHKGIVEDGELPDGWGLYEFDPKLRCLSKKVKAPYRKATTPDLAFIAAILRKAQEVNTPDSEINEAYKSGLEAGVKQGRSEMKYEAHDFEVLRDKVAAFEKASGVSISKSWEGGDNIGDAVRNVLSGGPMRRKTQLVDIAKQILAEFGETNNS